MANTKFIPKPEFNATLTKGRYTLLTPNEANPNQPGAIVFEEGEPVPVSADTKEYLEQNAVDAVDYRVNARKTETRFECKFTFEPINSGALSANVQTETR
ncbi:hypothetical protein CLV78_1256 [Aliiruegeria haliotis]|uniref:Uncharacterized protein n=1 Tax=Aliiruegeria haliotis TaxID=1280846 RepID=A0A2T0RDV6_9RHOB|nr:hypothetical protein [Aliiruegeria haliotis]PRY19290.1 hypothetical protein CLV78_1256 [Aliiruegeria haliotis]